MGNARFLTRIAGVLLALMAACALLAFTCVQAYAKDPVVVKAEGFELTIYYDAGNTPSSVKITGYTGSETQVKLPTAIRYNGQQYSVAGVGKSAFKGKTKIAKVVFPSNAGLKFVDGKAFSSCTNLKEIVVGNTLERISKDAFDGCSGIHAIAIMGSAAYEALSSMSAISSFTPVTAAYEETLYTRVLKIPKAASTVTLKAKTATYTGKAISIGKATVKGSTGKVTYKYYSNAKCTKSVAASKVVKAKTYYVKATVAADASHKGATSKAVKLVVKPAALSSAKLSAKSATYTGKAIKPAASATAKGGISVPAAGMKVTYKANKAVGTATVTVKGKGNFTGTKKLTFKINPRPTKATKVKGEKLKAPYQKNKGIRVSWKKAKPEADGTECRVLEYDKKSGSWKQVQGPYFDERATTSTVIGKKSLKSNTKYRVQVRAATKVGGKWYRSAWSEPVEGKTLK